MNFYKRHIGDYIRDTAHLSLLEHGVYCRLLDVYYTREAAIPDDQSARLIGARSKDERLALESVLAEFFEQRNGVWYNKRAEGEIAAAQQKAESNRVNGKSGGRPGKKSSVDGRGNPEKTQMVSGENPNVTLASNQEPVTNVPPNPRRGKTPPIGIKTFLDNCKANSVKPVPESDPVFTYAEQTGIPHEFLRLAWREFVDRHVESEKRYRDWRKAFRNCVRGNWYHLWWAGHDGEYALTTQGVQAQRKHREAA